MQCNSKVAIQSFCETSPKHKKALPSKSQFGNHNCFVVAIGKCAEPQVRRFLSPALGQQIARMLSWAEGQQFNRSTIIDNLVLRKFGLHHLKYRARIWWKNTHANAINSKKEGLQVLSQLANPGIDPSSKHTFGVVAHVESLPAEAKHWWCSQNHLASQLF